MRADANDGPDGVRGLLDAEGRLVEADAALADLHEAAGGRPGGMLAVPQIAALARLARRLGIAISRQAIAADRERDLDLWVRAEPAGEGVALTIGGWNTRPAFRPDPLPTAEREADFARAAADWVWETDERLNLTMVSAGAMSALGAAYPDIAGRPLTALFRLREHGDGSLPILTALAERRGFTDQLAELRIGTGELCHLAGVPLIDGTGRLAGFRGSATSVAGALRDRTANDEAPPPVRPDMLAFNERLGAALRDPLGQIISHAEGISAAGDGPLGPEYAGYATDIANAGRHLMSLVEDLVDLQAVERPDFRPAADAIDLAAISRRTASLLAGRASERGVRIIAPEDSEILPARGEERRVMQILVNLLTNAIRYSRDGGEVRLTLAGRDGFAAVTVDDGGKGIADGDGERIFAKFERLDPAEPGGTGLGLYIARRLARAMGGDLSLESKPGDGAMFALKLPAG